MAYVMSLFLWGLVLGAVAVVSNPSPYYGALSLVVVSGLGCGVLAWHGGLFLSLVLFLLYLGGMMVVFAYTTALAAESWHQTLGSKEVLPTVLMYLVVVFFVFGFFSDGWLDQNWNMIDDVDCFSVSRGDMEGIALMYSYGGGMLLVGGWGLFLTLFVVLELTHGWRRGVVRVF
uniref:NADH-ubiquinone oxidoreductase chain 6 n=1 Tax=Pelagocephalus marki TaxID=862803 RepID=F2EN98_9TELE|nr:NADH dehydrogenase subunit 6 [Pelagocephalus marki]BAK10066.1 NADH dehydrogenase subunit 6 [Pelagocephalus marki]